MRTRPSSSTAMSMAAAHGVLRCRLIGSAICRPIVSDGLSELIGSWKIMAMRLPRIARISSSLSFRRFWPSNTTSPAEILPGGSGIRRRIDMRGDALARARFAHDGQRLAGRQIERDVVDRLDDAALGAELGRQAFDAEKGRAHQARPLTRLVTLNSPASSSAPGRPRCGRRSGRGGPRPRAARRRSSSPTATTPRRRTASAARCRAPCR